MQIKDMNRSRKGTIILALVCLLLQIGLAPNIGMGNGRANLAMVFAGVYALTVGGRSGVVAGFIAGLVYDLTSTSPIGLMAALLTLMSYGLGVEARNRFVDGFVSSLSSFGVASLLATLAYHLFMVLLGEASDIFDIVFLRTLPSFALTFVAFLPFAFLQVRNSVKGHSISSGGKQASKHGHHYDMRDL